VEHAESGLRLTNRRSWGELATQRGKARLNTFLAEEPHETTVIPVKTPKSVRFRGIFAGKLAEHSARLAAQQLRMSLNG
jgi:hypothetical protein